MLLFISINSHCGINSYLLRLYQKKLLTIYRTMDESFEFIERNPNPKLTIDE